MATVRHGRGEADTLIDNHLEMFIEQFINNKTIDEPTERNGKWRFTDERATEGYRTDIYICARYLLRSLQVHKRFGAIPAAVLLAYKTIAGYDGMNTEKPISVMLRRKCYIKGMAANCRREQISQMETELLSLSGYKPCRYAEGVRVGEKVKKRGRTGGGVDLERSTKRRKLNTTQREG